MGCIMLPKGGQVKNSKKIFETYLRVHCYAAILKLIIKYLDAHGAVTLQLRINLYHEQIRT